MSKEKRQNGHLNSFLESALDQLVEEFREIEESEGSRDDLYAFEESMRTDLQTFPDRICKLIMSLMLEKRCSLMVATAAALAFSTLYSDDDFELSDD